MYNKLLKQLGGFMSLSGIGFIIDFTCYTALTTVYNLNVFYANMISAVPAVTFVFLISTRYIFRENLSSIKKIIGYIVYLIYQVLLLYCVSKLSQTLYDHIGFPLYVSQHSGVKKTFVKLFITPLTMTINFIMMKFILASLVKEKIK